MSTPNNLPANRLDLADGEVIWSPPAIFTPDTVQTSLPQQTAADRAFVISIIEDEASTGESMIGQQFDLVHYVCHPCEVKSRDDGERIEAVRTVLVDADGKTIQFVARSILQAINRLAYVRAQAPPFDPPIRVKLTRRKQIYSLIPIDEP